MALPNRVLPGFAAILYAQPSATPTALTLAQLSTLANVAAIAISGNQSVGARTTAVRGAVLVRKRIYPELFERYGIVPLQVQMLEPDWLDFNKDNSQDILFGQQFDSAGRLMGYWIRDSHPGETSLGIGVRVQSTFVPKEEISLHFDCRRAGQRMGLPFGTAAILTLRDMGDIRAAQQMKDKISACFFGVTTDSDVQQESNYAALKADGKGFGFDEIEPGAVEHLPPGRAFEAFTPPSSGDFVSTHREYAHAVAAAYEITYESMTGDLSNQTFFRPTGLYRVKTRGAFGTLKYDFIQR